MLFLVIKCISDFSDNSYGMDKNVPIPQDTVLTVNSTGHIINQWGNNFFFLPHMITIDKQNNVWVTDVAMHQVCTFYITKFCGGRLLLIKKVSATLK